MLKIVFAILITCCGLRAQSVFADHSSDLRSASSRYRDASIRFGKAVTTERTFGTREKRLGFDLLRLSSRMQIYSRTPGLSDRLRDCWWDLEDLHREIECVIFDRPVCPVTVELFPCYQRLVCAYYDLETALARVNCYHRRGQVHLHPSRGTPMFGSSRYAQSNWLDLILGAVASGIDSTRHDHYRNPRAYHDSSSLFRHSSGRHGFSIGFQSGRLTLNPPALDGHRPSRAEITPPIEARPSRKPNPKKKPAVSSRKDRR